MACVLRPHGACRSQSRLSIATTRVAGLEVERHDGSSPARAAGDAQPRQGAAGDRLSRQRYGSGYLDGRAGYGGSTRRRAAAIVGSAVYRHSTDLDLKSGRHWRRLPGSPDPAISVWTEVDANLRAGARRPLLGRGQRDGGRGGRGLWLKFSPQRSATSRRRAGFSELRRR